MPLLMVVSTWVYVAAFGLGVLILLGHRSTPPVRYAQIGAVVLFLGISVWATAVQYQFHGTNNWFVEYAYPLPQFVLCGFALGLSVRELADIGSLLLIGTVALLLRGPVTVPETIIQAMGGAWIAWRSIEQKGKDRSLRLGLVLYWGATLPIVMALPFVFHPPWIMLSLWIQLLHGVRIVALVVLVAWFWMAKGEAWSYSSPSASSSAWASSSLWSRWHGGLKLSSARMRHSANSPAIE